MKNEEKIIINMDLTEKDEQIYNVKKVKWNGKYKKI